MSATRSINPKLITRGVARCIPVSFRLKIAPHIAERVLNHAQDRIPGTYDVQDHLDEKREALERRYE